MGEAEKESFGNGGSFTGKDIEKIFALCAKKEKVTILSAVSHD